MGACSLHGVIDCCCTFSSRYEQLFWLRWFFQNSRAKANNFLILFWLTIIHKKLFICERDIHGFLNITNLFNKKISQKDQKIIEKIKRFAVEICQIRKCYIFVNFRLSEVPIWLLSIKNQYFFKILSTAI